MCSHPGVGIVVVGFVGMSELSVCDGRLDCAAEELRGNDRRNLLAAIGVSEADRRAHLDKWLTQWRAVCAGGPTKDPVFLAVHDAIARFAIPLSLLDELVAGVTMDLDRGDTGSPDTYATFDDLYRYCYLVASVVGLVCIRIFGYKDARAEKFAEETGIAFICLLKISRPTMSRSSRCCIALQMRH